MNPDLTAPSGAVRSGFIVFAMKAPKVYKQKSEHKTIAACRASA